MKPLKWLQTLLTHSKSRGDDAKVAFSNRTKFEQMIRNADWAMVAEVLGEVPPSLRALYATDVVTQSYWDVVTGRQDDPNYYGIAEFEALRREWRKHMWPDLQHGCLVIADDGQGNQFFLRKGTGPRWPVFFYNHDGCEIIDIADSLDTFLGMLTPSQDDES
jgi:hypothetical protein